MSHSRIGSRARRAGVTALTGVLLLGGSALAPVPASAATPTPLSSAICGTWVLQQVSSSTELNNLKGQIDAALAVPGVVGLSVRFPWKVVDTDFTLLNTGLAMARARGKAFSIRFMAGRHTPSRVIATGSPYYMIGSGERVPSPFYPDGTPNTVFEAAYDEFVGRLAAWSRSNGVKLLHLSWYGQDWAELNNGAEVRAVPGYTQANWTNSHKRLIDIGARHSGADLAVELPLSGYGPLSNGPSAALADRVIAAVGPNSDRFFIQANGWGPNGDWGAPNADVEAQFDQIWAKSVRRGQQAIQPQDYNWTTLYGHLYRNDANYAEVYLPSFNMASKALLASEAKKFFDTRCGGSPAGDTTAPTVAVSSPGSGARLSGSVTVAAQASDNVGVAKVDILVDGRLLTSATGASASGSWDTRTVADGTHSIAARATDTSGNVATSAAVAVTVDNTPADTQPPSQPGGLSYTRTRTSVKVCWKPSSDNVGVAGYRVHLNGTLRATTTATCASIGGLTRNTSYTVGVRAFDAAGNVSAAGTVTVRTKR